MRRHNTKDIERPFYKLVPFFIYLNIIALGCSNTNKKYVYSNYHKLKLTNNIRKIRSTVVNIFDIYFPSASSIINNLFILADSKADKILKIIDLESKELLKTFGTRGQGPGEFIGIRNILKDINNHNSFCIYDISTRTLKYFNINDVLKDNYYPNKIIKLSTENNGVPMQLILCPDNLMLGVGLFFKGRISFYDEKGNHINTIGMLPVILENTGLASQHSHGFSGNFVYKESTKEIYIATRLGTIVEKYSVEGKLLATLIGPDSFFPEYDIVRAGEYRTMTYNAKSRFGYIDICYNKKLDRLYLLYSGRYQFRKDNEKKGNYGNIVYILDRTDTLIEQIELDKDIFQVNISDDGSALYGLSDRDILRFEIGEKSSIGVGLSK